MKKLFLLISLENILERCLTYITHVVNSHEFGNELSKIVNNFFKRLPPSTASLVNGFCIIHNLGIPITISKVDQAHEEQVCKIDSIRHGLYINKNILFKNNIILTHIYYKCCIETCKNITFKCLLNSSIFTNIDSGDSTYFLYPLNNRVLLIVDELTNFELSYILMNYLREKLKCVRKCEINPLENFKELSIPYLYEHCHNSETVNKILHARDSLRKQLDKLLDLEKRIVEKTLNIYETLLKIYENLEENYPISNIKEIVLGKSTVVGVDLSKLPCRKLVLKSFKIIPPVNAFGEIWLVIKIGDKVLQKEIEIFCLENPIQNKHWLRIDLSITDLTLMLNKLKSFLKSHSINYSKFIDNYVTKLLKLLQCIEIFCEIFNI